MIGFCLTFRNTLKLILIVFGIQTQPEVQGGVIRPAYVPWAEYSRFVLVGKIILQGEFLIVGPAPSFIGPKHQGSCCDRAEVLVGSLPA